MGHTPRGYALRKLLIENAIYAEAKPVAKKCSFLSKCVHRFNSDEYCICMACSSNFAGGPETYEKYKRIFLQNVKTEMKVVTPK